jgi:biotin carboxylase
MIPEGLDFSFSAIISRDETMGASESLDFLCDQLMSLEWPIQAVIAGAETGVELADELSERMGLRTNGTTQSSARRNKYIMGETVRRAGIRAAKQMEVKTWVQVQAFIEEWQPEPFRVIAKPMDSAGSEDVTLCRSMEELRKAFGYILGKKNGLGLINHSVLIQEYLEGIEYIIDMCSRDGMHKLVGIWEYDRRPTNGASFVCHSQRMLVVADDPKYAEMVEYQKRVITALGIRNGPSHGEVKWYKSAPILVEVGSRCHGGDGLWVKILEEATGISQVQATVDLYLEDASVFNALPMAPSRLKECGEKWLISYQTGTLKCIRPEAVSEIQALRSYRGHQFFVKEGQRIRKTQNCFSWAGLVMLCDESRSQMEADMKRYC